MPRYFFDTADSGDVSRDDVGLELANLEEVRRAATEALPQMAMDALPDGATRQFAVEVRDEAGARIFKASLSFRSEWLSPVSNDL
jgi:hypothetical protein